MIYKIIIIVFLLGIIYSLFAALYKMMRIGSSANQENQQNLKDKDNTVRYLTIRISLSIILFILFILGYLFEIIPRQGF